MDIHKFMENNYHGFKNGKYEKLKYYDFQKKVINLIENNRFSLIKKSRQLFITNLLSLYVAREIYENKKNVMFCGNRQDNAKHFKSLVMLALKHIYPDIEFEENNKTSVYIKGKGSLKCISSHISNFCSVKPDLLIFDEAAYIENFKQTYEVGLSKLKINGKIIVVSTPSYVTDKNKINGFFELYENSMNLRNDFTILNLNYKDNPLQNNSDWLEKIKLTIGDNDKFRMEILAEFLARPEIKNKKNKTNLIQFRVNDDLLYKISMKLIEKDINVSKYLRDLILKDMDI